MLKSEVKWSPHCLLEFQNPNSLGAELALLKGNIWLYLFIYVILKPAWAYNQDLEVLESLSRNDLMNFVGQECDRVQTVLMIGFIDIEVSQAGATDSCITEPNRH